MSFDNPIHERVSHLIDDGSTGLPMVTMGVSSMPSIWDTRAYAYGLYGNGSYEDYLEEQERKRREGGTDEL